MRLGLTIWGFEVGTRAAMDVAIEAERRGFDSVFLVEGVFSNDAVTTVAVIAGCTSRIGIGTGIANIYLRHPVMLGIAAAAIDEISGGRLVLGIGPNNEAMISRAGLSWRDPRQALRETTTPCVPRWRARGCEDCVRHARPRARFRSTGRPMALETCEAAGRHADGLMLYLCTKDRYGRAVERMRRGAITAGRSPDDLSVSLLIPTFIHADLATARRAAREFLVHYASQAHYAKVFTASGFGAEMEAVRKASGNQDRAAAMAAPRSLLAHSQIPSPAVRGYREEGTTTTPFDMCVLNDLDRFHLVSDVIDRVPKLGARAAYAKQAIRDKLMEHKAYIARHGDDMPEITGWKWGQGAGASAGGRLTESDNV
jgi:alkanesulfonate monooxygenase SsuD/methylene tetrahydromethanopterin reductase-like flavin-dependent oxidoreductase (luciferase family)